MRKLEPQRETEIRERLAGPSGEGKSSRQLAAEIAWKLAAIVVGVHFGLSALRALVAVWIP